MAPPPLEPELLEAVALLLPPVEPVLVEALELPLEAVVSMVPVELPLPLVLPLPVVPVVAAEPCPPLVEEMSWPEEVLAEPELELACPLLPAVLPLQPRVMAAAPSARARNSGCIGAPVTADSCVPEQSAREQADSPARLHRTHGSPASNGASARLILGVGSAT